jgi:hypothetical protein
LNETAYRQAKALYEARYIRLVHDFYLPKEDATGYLNTYAQKENGVWHAKNRSVRAFVDHYWNRYRKIGQETMPFED